MGSRWVTFARSGDAWGVVFEHLVMTPGLTSAVELQGQDAAGRWTASAADVDLTIEPEGEPSRSQPVLSGFEQRCRVRGRVGDQLLDCPGRRCEHSLDLPQLHSLRDFWAWFEPDLAVVLTSARPKRSPGQEDDLLSATLLEGDAGTPVHDPRLSSTYSPGGEPLRVGLELWLGDDEDEHPQRVAGEALGVRLDGVLDGLRLRASAFAAHTLGRNGVGVYLLALA